MRSSWNKHSVVWKKILKIICGLSCNWNSSCKIIVVSHAVLWCFYCSAFICQTVLCVEPLSDSPSCQFQSVLKISALSSSKCPSAPAGASAITNPFPILQEVNCFCNHIIKADWRSRLLHSTNEFNYIVHAVPLRQRVELCNLKLLQSEDHYSAPPQESIN